MWLYILNVIVILAEIRTVLGFDKFVNFQDQCGTTINSHAGELSLNTKRLKDNECSVTIRMKKEVEENDVRMFFYFTKFHFYVECDDSNVTLVDGYKGKNLNGLPRYLCGHNITLASEGQYFQTQARQMTVTFRRSVYGEHFSGDFCMKFLEFHDDFCLDKRYGRCLDGRCIGKDYHCSDDIRGCGADSCRQDEERIISFMSSVKGLGFILGVAVVLFLLYHAYILVGTRIKMRRTGVINEVSQKQSNQKPVSEVQMTETHYIRLKIKEEMFQWQKEGSCSKYRKTAYTSGNSKL